MSYTFAARIHADRIEKSLAAYEKYVEKNGEPTKEQMVEFFKKLPELRKKGPGLYWWGLKVYNGWLYETEKKYIWG